jgi:hypothetical protein
MENTVSFQRNSLPNETAGHRLLTAALECCARGWSIIPMRAIDLKLPACKWAQFQNRRASAEQLRDWFARPDVGGMAVVFGKVSGGLASIDFDRADAYQDWAADHPELAAELPTVKTSRGYHVYFRLSADCLAALRRGHGKRGHGAILLDNGAGELRADVGCYSVLPPSPHPSGIQYRWQRRPGETVPVVQLDSLGILQQFNPEVNTEALDDSGLSKTCKKGMKGERRPHTRRLGAANLVSLPLAEAVDLAIVRTLPSHVGQRHDRVFEFARWLKSHPKLAGASVEQLRPYVKQWHEAALPFIGTEPFLATWEDFQHGWPLVTHPKHNEPLRVLWNEVQQEDPPACAAPFADDPQVVAVIQLCRRLQADKGGHAFFLASRALGELLGTSHVTASYVLKGLRRAGVLRLVRKGSRAKRKASVYRYLGD